MVDEDRGAHSRRLKRDIYIAAGLTVIAFVVALFFIVDRASYVANGLALDDDFELLNAELSDQRHNAEYYMNEGTTTIDGFVTMSRRQPDMADMADAMKTWIADSYGLQQIMVVDADGTIRIAMMDGKDVEDPSSLPIAPLAAGFA